MSQIDLQWFAAEEEGRTEDPTQHRLDELRKEGRVAKSSELAGIIVFLCTVVFLLFYAPFMEKTIRELFIFYFNKTEGMLIKDRTLYLAFLKYLAILVLPFGVIGIVAGIAINSVENRGFIFTTKPIAPNFSKLIPNFRNYFQRTLFSRKGMINVIKSIFKVIVLCAIDYFIIRSDLNKTLGYLHAATPDIAFKMTAQMIGKLLVTSAVVLLVFGIVDWVLERRSFLEENKMSKQQVKEEYKEMEGNPEVKAQIQQAMQQEFSLTRAVRTANVVITNPTHYAVALVYENQKHIMPVVAAKGMDETALTIKRLAQQFEVPIIEDRPLARSLYANSQVGSYVPTEYMNVLSIVFAKVQKMVNARTKNQ